MTQSIQVFAIKLAKQLIPEIETIIQVYNHNQEKGFNVYLDFIKNHKSSLEKILLEGLEDPIEVGYISSRLLRDPIDAGLKIKEEKGSYEEIEAQIVGYLKGILQLLFCVSKGLKGWQFPGSVIHEKSVQTLNIWKVDTLTSFLQIIRHELDGIDLPKGLNNDNTTELKVFAKNMISIEPNEKYEYLYDKSDIEKTDVPFTARLMAYYRSQELKKDNPLIIDPFAEDLAGDLSSYIEKHEFIANKGDYPLIRTHYIDKNLLSPWCNRKRTQIVLLGAGLDTRAYRFLPVGRYNHVIFELDFEDVIKYKEKVLHDKKPLCKLVRLVSDLSQPNWKIDLNKNGFSSEIPTFWILEGVAYYVDRSVIVSLLKTLAEVSHQKSQIFVDVCVPALAGLVFGPFTRYFKWGINKNEIPPFFAETGWKVSYSYADNYDQGREVGQRGMIFVQGEKSYP